MKYVTYSNSRMVLTSTIFFFNDVLSERRVEKERERHKNGEGEGGKDGEGEEGRTRAMYYAKLQMNATEEQATERRKKRKRRIGLVGGWGILSCLRMRMRPTHPFLLSRFH